MFCTCHVAKLIMIIINDLSLKTRFCTLHVVFMVAVILFSNRPSYKSVTHAHTNTHTHTFTHSSTCAQLMRQYKIVGTNNEHVLVVLHKQGKQAAEQTV